MTTDSEAVSADLANERDGRTSAANMSALRTVLHSVSSRTGRFIARPFRDLHAMYLTLARVDFTEVFSRASENYALWHTLADSVASEYPASPNLIKQRYRRFVVREAYWYFRHNQIMARASAEALAAGSSMLFGSWALILSKVSNMSHFIWITIATGIPFILFLLYFAVSRDVNVERTWKTGVIVAAAGVTFQLAATQNPGVELDSDHGYISICLVLFGVFASLIAVAGGLAEGKKYKEWFRRHPAEVGTVFSFQVASTLETQQLGLLGNEMHGARWELLMIAKCIDNSVESNLDTVASQRGREAARKIRECRAWLLLQQPGTVDSIRDLVRSVAFAFLTGFYHYLPVDPHWSPAVPKAKRRASAVRIIRQIASAILPLAVVVVIAVFSFPLPTFLEQWAVALAVIWFIVKIVLFIDPDFRKTWKEVREILSSRDSFTDQQRKAKDE